MQKNPIGQNQKKLQEQNEVKGPLLNPSWIKDRFEDETINYAEKLAEKLVNIKFSITQLRNVFNEIRRLQMKLMFDMVDRETKQDILMLKARIDYNFARLQGNKSKNEIIEFHQLLELSMKSIIEVINNDQELKKRFKNFTDLMEAIVAFHKKFENKKEKNHEPGHKQN